MAAPTLSVYAGNPTATPGNSSRTVVASWTAGDKIVVLAGTEDQTITLGTPTATGIGTLTSKITHSQANSCWAAAWESTAASTQTNVTVSSTITGGVGNHGWLLVIVISAASTAGIVYTNPTGSTATTASVVRAGQDSSVFMLAGDWGATATRTPIPSTGGTSVVATQDSGRYTAYGFRWDSQGAAGTTSYGVSGSAFADLFTKIYVEIEGTASGTSYTGSPSDAEGITDSATRVQDAARAPADAVGITDANSTAAANVRTADDALGITDAPSTAAVNVRSAADPVGITDSAVAALTANASASDPVGITDSASAAAGRVTAPADPVGLTDAASAVADSARAPADTVGIADAASVALGYDRAPADVIGIADEAATAIDYVRTVADSVGITDSATGSGAATANFYAAADPSGTVFAAAPYRDHADQGINVGLQYGSFSEIPITAVRYRKKGAVNDDTTVSVAIYDLADTSAPVATGSRLQTSADPDGWIIVPLSAPYTQPAAPVVGEVSHLARAFFPNGWYIAGDSQRPLVGQSFQGPLYQADSVVNRFDYGNTAAFPTGTAELFFGVDVVATANVSALTQSVNDPLGIADAATGELTSGRSAADPVGITDTASAAAILARTPADPVGLMDAVSTVRSITASVADSVGITDSAGQGVLYTATISDSVAITDLDAPLVISVRYDLADPVGITDAASAQLLRGGAADDAVGITDAASTAAALARAAADPVGISDAVTVSVTGPGGTALSDPLGITDSVSAVMARQAVVADSVGITDQATRAAAIARLLADAVSAVDQAQGGIGQLVLLADALGITDTVTGVLRHPKRVKFVAPLSVRARDVTPKTQAQDSSPRIRARS